MKLILVLFISIFFISCTRSLNKQTDLKLSIPASSKPELLETTMYPFFASININYKNKPTFSRTFEFNRGGNKTQTPTNTGDLEIVVPGVTPGSQNLIQLLVVYEDPLTGAMEFNYGDSIKDITSGENLIEIKVSAIGSSSKEINFGGRYLTEAGKGPSGLVSMMLHPPNSKPAMEIEKISINNGWFQFFHPGGDAVVSYIIKKDNNILFDKIISSSSVFSVAGSSRLKVDVPSYLSKDNQFNYKQELAKELYYGFFKSASSALDFTNYKACFADRVHSVPKAYGAISPNFSPLKFDPNGTQGTDVVISGGSTQTFEDLYNSATCDLSTNENLIFHSEHIANGLKDNAVGIKGPFRMISAFKNHDSAFSSVDVKPGVSIDLKWSYLPGVLGSSISGATVFAKYSNNYSSSDDNNRDFSCQVRAELQGMTSVGDVTGEQYSYTGAGGLPLISSSTVYADNFSFLICPFAVSLDGKKRYKDEGLDVHCLSNCSEEFNFGMGTDDHLIDTAVEFKNLPDSYGAKIEVVTIASDTVQLTLSNQWGMASELNSGDEVAINVVASGNNSCSVSAEPISSGHLFFTRVLTSSPSVTVPNDDFFDRLNPVALSASNLASGTDFCFVTITKVLHYKNLTLENKLSTAAFELSQKTYQNIFLKVSGALTFETASASIDVSDKGFSGSPSSSGYYGEGVAGSHNSGTPTETGGGYHGASWSGGGASFGSGGINSSSQYAQGLHYEGFYMGGGAAADGSNAGGIGGGAIYVSAKQLNILANSMIAANGQAAIGSTGAGAGGSIWFLFDEVSNSSNSNFTIIAKGGYAGTSGAGGGGFLKGKVCNGDTNNFSFINTGGGSTGGVTQKGEDGNLFDNNTNNYLSWACER